MLRIVASSCLFLFCMTSPGMGRDSFLLGQQAPEGTTAQKIAEYRQQGAAAEQSMQASEAQLRKNLAELLTLRSSNGSSPQLDSAIADLQKLLAQLQQLRQSESSQVAAAAIKPDMMSAATQADRATKFAQQAQSVAEKGAQITDQATNLALSGKKAGPSPAPAPPRTPARPTPPRQAVTPAVREDRSPASVGEASPLGTPAATNSGQPAPASEGDQEAAWFNSLKNGRLTYSVPPTMKWKVPATVTVQINGEKAPAPGSIANQSGEATIKVARHMKVMVSAPANPDEFIITPEPDTQPEQFVPEDGPTTWNFSVTPRYTAASQQIVVQAWVIYDTNTSQELPVYQAVVNVHVPSVGECLKRLFEGDPDYWLKYGLPGGAGFVFLSGVVTGLWKWFASRKRRAAVAS